MKVVRLARVLTPVAVAAGVAVAAVVSAPPAFASPVPNAPLVMAHKGWHYPYGTAPENSTGAINAAAAMGMPIEIDILLSKPTKTNPHGVPFVFHDQTLRRMTNRAGKLSSFSAAELDDTCLVTVPGGDVCSEYNIPRLGTVLTQVSTTGVALDIEIKHDTLTTGQALSIVKRLENADAWSWDIMPSEEFHSPLILSPWSQPLRKVRKVAAERGETVQTEFLAEQVTVPAPEDTAGSVMTALYYKRVTPEIVDDLHLQGLLVDAFTANDCTSWEKLVAADVDWVITDNLEDYEAWAAGAPCSVT